MTRTREKILAIVGTVTATAAVLGGIRFAGPAAADSEPQVADRQRQAEGVDSADPSLTAPSEVTPSPTTPPVTTSPPTSPSPSPTDGQTCSTAIGDPADVADPGIGAVTVTIVVCDGKISTVSSVLSQSNFGRNKKALLAMDTLALEYATTDINMVNFSGATCTSEAYRASLQSALKKMEI